MEAYTDPAYQDLSHIYYDPKSPGSLGGPDRLSVAAKIPRRLAEAYLESQKPYTVNRAVRHKFKRRKITSPCVDYLWQADLLTVSKLKRLNSGVSYLLTVIDVLSRYAFVRPLKKKTATEVTKAFEDIFKTSNRSPKFLQTDRGTEFDNRIFKKLLQDYGVSLFHNHSPLKAAMVERFNRTLMLRISKLCTLTKNRYISHLQDIVYSYNTSVHRITKHRPVDVNEFNQLDVWANSNAPEPCVRNPGPKFRVNDFVRIKKQRDSFAKGYSNNFTDDVYRIREVIRSNPVTYLLSDNSGEDVLGIFYTPELAKIRL